MAPLPARTRRRLAALVTTALLASTILSTSAVLAQDATTLLADANKAVKAKDWAAAAKAFEAANKAQPTEPALDGLANALYQGGQLGEAHAAYTEWLEKYGAQNAAKKKNAEARIKELGEKTGAITLVVNEAGAQVSVDEKPMGTTPLAGPLRLTAGPHHVRVAKDGFVAFDQAPNVGAGSATTLQATLSPASTKGKVSVKEKTGQNVRVVVDGVDVGPAPWTGELDAGAHEITLRGPGLAAIPKKISVEGGKTQELELAAAPASASVKIGTSDGKGLIYLDEKLVGEGNFIAEIPAGTHKLRITREGYDPFEEDLVVKDKEPLARSITLKLSSTIMTEKVQADRELLEGIYGGFGFNGYLMPWGTHSSIQRTCENKKAAPTLVSCDAPGGLGGGVGGFVGYHWEPVGIELYAQGEYDERTLKNDWNAAFNDAGLGPDPARLETFTLRRFGGLGMARVRVEWQTPRVRLAFIGGAGVSYRIMSLERATTLKENPSIKDGFISNKPSYTSPVIAFEPTAMLRLTKGVALSLGWQMLFENPQSFLDGDETPKTNAERDHTLGGTRSLTTRPYELAAKPQIFMGPVLGMMFGP